MQIEYSTERRITLRGILAEAWRIYGQRIVSMSVVMAIIWGPLELLSSYMDHFVFDPDDIARSAKFYRFLENFIGIIATAAVVFIAFRARNGEEAPAPAALIHGLKSWGRLWWTRVLTGLSIILGLLLLVIPGIYLAVRLSLAGNIAILEGSSGSRAMGRSLELTKGHFWLVFRLGLILLLLLLLVTAAVIVPALFIPACEHWLVAAAIQLGADVIASYGTVAWVIMYARLAISRAQGFEGAGQPTSAAPIPSFTVETQTTQA